MTKHEENKVTMYRAVLNFLRSNLDKLAGIPVFASLVDTFEEDIQAVDARHNEHQTVAAGANDHKQDAEDTLIAEAVALSKPCYAWAAAQKDQQLQARFRVTESELGRMRDTELLNRMRSLHQLMVAHQEELAEYGVTPEKLAAFGGLIDTYEKALDDQETLSGVKTAARQALKDAFRAVDALLYDQLDSLMESFRTTDKPFYDQYQSIRNIKDI